MMAGNNQRNGYDKQQHHTNPWLYPIQIGFFAGLIWGIIRWMFYEMKFTKVLPGFAADPFFKESFLKTAWGEVVGIAFFVLFSIAAALLYKVALGKLRGPWPGVVYGAIWWAVLFVALGPLLQFTDGIRKEGWNTLYTELCVFLLWGLFIGYSIAFEFTDEASREPIKAQ
ncbi:YqhR family membrane protein [Paenibacillus sp. 2TAB23]|uniref:YqhR family membrane protein n=1 Tax=Paenibacillus sp. 2TAB23 TaxID=3233004 RepID=UPI003F97F858